MYAAFLLLLLSLFSTLSTSLAASATEWRGRSIYQIVTDRFARTDGSLSAPCDTSERRYCGGTWRGIINKLDYIHAMGFTAIWISPSVGQINATTAEGESYHGYWPENMYSFNARFGTEQDFKDLVTAAHDRGMFVMLDLVLNHFANPTENISYSNFVPFNESRYFHPQCRINWGNETSIQRCWMGNGYVHLPDIDTENPWVEDTIVNWVASLVTKYKIDGFRLDAMRNIRKPFWQRVCKTAGVFCQGEVWSRDPKIICPFQDYVDSLHNYPFKEIATQAFTSRRALSDVRDIGIAMQAKCRDVTVMGCMMENHDNQRLASYTSDWSRLRTMGAYNMLSDGIPIVYYGQEQALAGHNDPANREALWLTEYPTGNDTLVPFYQKLNAFRNHASSKSSYLTTHTAYTMINDGVIAMKKADMLVVLTNTGSSVHQKVTVSGYANTVDLVEIVSCAQLQTMNGRVSLAIAGEPVVLYPKALLAGSGVCGL